MLFMMYSYDDLRLFCKVVDCGSYTKAAKLCKISHTTISRRMKILEDSLKITLLHVDSHNCKPTKEGELLYGSVRSHLSNIDAAVNCLYNDDIIGDLKISLASVFSAVIISPHIMEFKAQYPKIKLHLVYQSQQINLLNSGYDLAVVSYVPQQQNVKIRSLGTINYKLYCTRKYANEFGIPQKPQDLEKHSIVGRSLADESVPEQISFQHRISQKIYTIPMPKDIVVSDTYQSSILLYSNKVIVPLFEGHDFKHYSDDVIEVLSDYDIHTLKFYLLTHPQHNNQAVKVFCDFVIQCCLKFNIL